ncbi:hypothetical protein [Streptomyces sp. NPDC102437]|uniref:hypothetical protein n=1 Tax=Streptomyces sp. NPDC102437 TaxID=3366175 RepID=UPI00382F5E62
MSLRRSFGRTRPWREPMAPGGPVRLFQQGRKAPRIPLGQLHHRYTVHLARHRRLHPYLWQLHPQRQPGTDPQYPRHVRSLLGPQE